MTNIKVWRDLRGRRFELKAEKGQWWHRQKGTKDWIRGRPPGMVEKARIPVDKRPKS